MSEEISGIFVKSIARGSAADMSNKIRVNDQIIEVDGRSLYGYTNHEAVEVLRSAGKVVKLRLARYLRGTKYEQLQQAIASTDIATVSRSPHPLDHQPASHASDAFRTSIGMSPVGDDVKRKNMGPPHEVVRGSSTSSALPFSRSEEETTQMEILPPPPEYLLQNEWSQRIGNEYTVVVSDTFPRIPCQ